MPDRFSGSKRKWEQLEAPLLDIDDILISFSQEKNLLFEQNHNNWPGRLLQWEKGGIKRQIQIYLENKSDEIYNFWLCAYQDKENYRFWKNQYLKSVVPFQEISDNLTELLEKGYSIVDSWTEKDLKKIIYK
jgi:hypothetical protein